MNLVKRNKLFFPTLFNEVFAPDWFGGIDTALGQLPAVNIKEGEKEFELALAVPGVQKEDFNIEIDNDVLTISLETKVEETTKEEHYSRKEFSFSSFKRSFSLPETVDADQINATYENGVLKFALPKKEEALPKPKRLIEIGK